MHGQDYRLHLRGRDFAVMGALTLVYAVVAFWHLGARKAPQTGYVSTAAGRNGGDRPGQRHENFHLYYYGGISDTQFSVATSDDGVSLRHRNGRVL